MADAKATKKTAKTTKSKQVFIYKAKGQKNKKLTGEIVADNKSTAHNQLKKQGMRNIKLTVKRPPPAFLKIFPANRVTNLDVAVFARQMATMQHAGVPLVQALKIVIDSTSKPIVATLIAQLKDEVESGGSFSECLRNHPEHFEDLFCNLVDAGESSGNLDTMLDRIATYKEKSESLKRKLKKAMYYPIAVMIIATLVTVILLIKVVPTFQNMFKSFGAELPAFTRLIIHISELIQAHGFIILCGLVASIFFLLKAYKSNKLFRNKVQRLSLKLPIFGKILHKAAVARFARTLATTFAAGVPLTDALVSVAKASGNIEYYHAIMQIREGVSVGQRIQASMVTAGIFPSMAVQMVAIGEETGSLDSMLTKVAIIYEDEVDVAVDGLSSLLEPLIMMILGIIVGGLVIAMYLPIFKLGSVI